MTPWSTCALTAVGLAAAITVICTACAKPSAAPPAQGGSAEQHSQLEPVCGGTEDNTDPNAPKTIADTQINSFSFSASVSSFIASENGLLTPERYEFSAVREGDGAACSCIRYGNEHTFTADAAFLDELQAIVAKHDFAAHNGIDYFTAGLPDDFGGTLEVQYASGERIYAADNQSPFYTEEAVTDLARLFFRASRSFEMIPQDEAYVLSRMRPNALILDVRRQDEYAEGHIRGAVCLPNEDIQAGKLDALPDKDQILLIYCRSGRRSKEAAQVLADAGYWNVYEFGGIQDWTGDIVKEED